jgi:H/ACA ribonucleoprotein complex subunit 3
MDVYIHQKKVRLSARQLIGQGGEAEVYRLPPDTAVKLFKPPSHGDFSHQPQAQQAAQQRLDSISKSSGSFPKICPQGWWLPSP